MIPYLKFSSHDLKKFDNPTVESMLDGCFKEWFGRLTAENSLLGERTLVVFRKSFNADCPEVKWLRECRVSQMTRQQSSDYLLLANAFLHKEVGVLGEELDCCELNGNSCKTGMSCEICTIWFFGLLLIHERSKCFIKNWGDIDSLIVKVYK